MKYVVVILSVFAISCAPKVIGPTTECIRAIVPENMRFVPEQYLRMIAKASIKYKVPILYLSRLLREESNFNPHALNYNDNGTIDMGIAQLNNKYIPEYVWKYHKMKLIDPFDPEVSINIAAAILANNYRVLKDWERSIQAYNCGLSKVYARKVPDKTKAYAIRIIGK